MGIKHTVPILYFALVASTFASNWPRFRGPNGTGVSQDEGLPVEIDRDKNVLWSIETPPGNSSPIFVNGRLFITAYDGDQRMVVCYDGPTGKLVWRRSIKRRRTETFSPINGPTTPTPATDGSNIFVFFPEFGLLAYNRDGKELWRTPMGPFTSIQGLAASPVYVGGKIVLLVDTPEEAYLIALDAETGKQMWRNDRPTGVLGSYATPTLYESADGATQIVVAGAVELTGYDANTGNRLWWANGITVFPTAPPFVIGDSVYTVEPADQGWPPFGEVLSQFDKDKDGQVAVEDAAGDTIWTRSLLGIDKNVGDNDGLVTREEYDKASSGIIGGGLTRTRVNGKGDVSASHVVWRNPKGMPGLAGALLYRNLLYVVRKAIVSTFDPETGNLVGRDRMMSALGEYYASPVAGDGKIYFASLEGKVTVLQSGPDWRVLSTGDLSEKIIATPAIADGRVYIRTEGSLYSFEKARP